MTTILDAALTLLREQKRAADSIPFEELEAYALRPGSLTAERRAEVDLACQHDAATAGIIDAMRHPDPGMTAAMWRGVEEGSRRMADTSPMILNADWDEIPPTFDGCLAEMRTASSPERVRMMMFEALEHIHSSRRIADHREQDGGAEDAHIPPVPMPHIDR